MMRAAVASNRGALKGASIVAETRDRHVAVGLYAPPEEILLKVAAKLFKPVPDAADAGRTGAGGGGDDLLQNIRGVAVVELALGNRISVGYPARIVARL